MIIIAVSLYGTDPKYTEGMIINATQIIHRFPSPDVWVYINIASDVPDNIRERLSILPRVKLVPVERKPGSANMFDRFMTIDLPECDVLFVRDADSRVHERDAACIEDFLASDKQLHIIRDHRCHRSRIMGGMWGIRKSALIALKTSMCNLLNQWTIIPAYMNDQNFLSTVIYPLFLRNAMIHDRYEYFEPKDRLTPFRVREYNAVF